MARRDPLSRRSRGALGVGPLAFVLVAGSNASEDGEYRIYGAGDTIGFGRHCTDANPYRVQAFAQIGSADGRAHALVLAYPWPKRRLLRAQGTPGLPLGTGSRPRTARTPRTGTCGMGTRMT